MQIYQNNMPNKIRDIKKEDGVKHAKRIANNTARIEYDNGNVAIRLHETDVLTVRPSGNIVLDHGGYKTLTTKQRINEHLPKGWHLTQKNYEWFVCYRVKKRPNKTDYRFDWPIQEFDETVRQHWPLHSHYYHPAIINPKKKTVIINLA